MRNVVLALVLSLFQGTGLSALAHHGHHGASAPPPPSRSVEFQAPAQSNAGLIQKTAGQEVRYKPSEVRYRRSPVIQVKGGGSRFRLEDIVNTGGLRQ